MDFALVRDSLPRLLGGALLSVQLTLAALLVGLAFGILLALVGRSRLAPARLAVAAYVFVFRGTPLLVQLFLIYYGLGQFETVRASPLWPFLREPFWCTVLALALNTAAYSSEIVRGGLEAVPRGLVEGGRALGMSRPVLWWTIVLPIAVRQALPAYGNEMVLMVKASALASTVTLLEVTGIARQIAARTYQPLEIFTAAGIIYLTINFAITRLVRWLEHRMSPERRAAARG